MKKFALEISLRFRHALPSLACYCESWIYRLCCLCLIMTLWLGASAPLSAQQPVSLAYLHTFGSGYDGRQPFAPMILGQNNVLYGSTRVGGSNDYGMVFKVNLDGTGYTMLYSFSSYQTDAGSPPADPGGTPLVQGADGALYGVVTGGTNVNGFAFKLNQDGTGFEMLHLFGDVDGGPMSLMQGADGFLYGASYSAIFKLGTNGGGNYAVLRQLTNSGDGIQPMGRLIQDTQGTLYGTSYRGGTNFAGTIFKLNTDGSGYQILHTFLTNGVDGQAPWAGLVQGTDGALYGTTTVGGTNDAGTIFELDTNASGYQVLYNFLTNGVDGQQPFGALVQGLDNKLYGTARLGGTNGGGTIFEMGLGGGNYTGLYDFGSALATNAMPVAGLVQGPASDGSGVLYGTTVNFSGALFGIVVNPPLTITPVVSQSGANSPVVIWPAWALNYVLQTTTNLSSGAWVVATNGLAVTGLQLTNATSPNAYFRLSLQ